MADDLARSVTISRWIDLAPSPQRASEVEDIFFEASATKSFAGSEARALFRRRWLGRYLDLWPELAYVAESGQGSVAGYLVGCLDDPARSSEFSDIEFFSRLSALTRDYPAQLHVNLAPSWRGLGIGRRLIEAFAADARRAGAPGVHVITGRGMRNVRFYEANGFREKGALVENGRELVFLARPLDG